MTILQAITRADDLKPNQYTAAQKILWLSDLEGQVKAEVFDRHADSPAAAFTGYTENTDTATELLVPAPYDGIYPLYLHAMIDFYNSEFTKYSNSKELFNSDYLSFQGYWNRNHLPTGPAGMSY